MSDHKTLPFVPSAPLLNDERNSDTPPSYDKIYPRLNSSEPKSDKDVCAATNPAFVALNANDLAHGSRPRASSYNEPAVHRPTNIHPTPPIIRPIRNSTVGPLSSNFIRITCPHCHTQTVPLTVKRPNALAFLSSLLCCFCGCWMGCCLCPFLCEPCNDTEHICRNCHKCISES